MPVENNVITEEEIQNFMNDLAQNNELHDEILMPIPPIQEGVGIQAQINNVWNNPFDDEFYNQHVNAIKSRMLTTLKSNNEDTKFTNLLNKYGYNNFKELNKNVLIRYYYNDDGKFTSLSFPYHKNKLSKLMLIINIDNYSYDFKINNGLYLTNHSISSVEKIKQLAFVKIKSYKESSKLFGYGKIKKEMFEKSLDIVKDNGFGIQKKIKGQLYIIDSILPEFTCKKDKSVRDIFQIKYNGKNLKFAATDLELIYPDINEITKGFNNTKDRTVKKNSKVLIKTKSKDKTTGIVLQKLEPVGYMQFSKVLIGDKVKIINNKKLKVI